MKIFTPTRLILPVIAFLLLAGCGSKKSSEDQAAPKTITDSIAVQSKRVELQTIRISKNFPGSLEGEEQANIVAKISERITAIKVQVGDMVSDSQLVLTLDKSGASSQYYQADANYRNAKKNYERMQSLLAEGAISQQALDGARTSYEVAQANFEAAKSAVDLIAPIAGIVTAVNVNVGDLSTPGSPLVTLARINKMKATFTAGESDIEEMYIGQPVKIYSESRPDLIKEGKIVEISQSADVHSRMFEVKALFDNTPDKWFKPGMFVDAEVLIVNQQNVLAIPNPAITQTDQNSYVFVIKNNVAHKTFVQTGPTNGEITEIISGLRKGEDVVVQGMNNLQDGSTVKIYNPKGNEEEPISGSNQ